MQATSGITCSTGPFSSISSCSSRRAQQTRLLAAPRAGATRTPPLPPSAPPPGTPPAPAASHPPPLPPAVLTGVYAAFYRLCSRIVSVV